MCKPSVHLFENQPLTPQLFQWWQDAVNEHLCSMLRAQPDGHGIEQIEFECNDGVLQVHALRAVTARGTLLEYPGNVSIDPRSLANVFTDTRRSVLVSLAIPLHRHDRAIASERDDALCRYRIIHAEVADQNGGVDPWKVSLPLRVLNARLIVDGESHDGMELLPIGRITNEVEMSGAVDTAHVPTIRRIGAWPTLLKEMRGFLEFLRSTARGLAAHIPDTPFRIAANAPEVLETLHRLQAVNRGIGRLTPLLEDHQTRPRELHRALSEMHGDCAFFGALRWDDPIAPYVHDRPAEALRELVARIRRWMSATPNSGKVFEESAFHATDESVAELRASVQPAWFAERRQLFLRATPGLDRSRDDIRRMFRANQIRLLGGGDLLVSRRQNVRGCAVREVRRPTALPDRPGGETVFFLIESDAADPRWRSLCASDQAVIQYVADEGPRDAFELYAVPPALVEIS